MDEACLFIKNEHHVGRVYLQRWQKVRCLLPIFRTGETTMCGIAGIHAYSNAATSVLPEELRQVRDYMIARGPDGKEEWFFSDWHTALTHHRTSLIEPSERVVRPNHNDEIYNYRALRKRLKEEGYRS